MVSSPDVIRALYSGRDHGLPPGRTLSLRPIVGPRSVLLLEGAEHLARRRVMLPPFHGDRMRAYEPIVREAARAGGRALADGPAVRGPSPHAGGHPRGDPARRVRRRRRRAPRAPARALADLLGPRLPRPAVLGAVVATARRAGSAGPPRGAAWPRSTRPCSSRSRSAGPRRTRRRTRRHLLAADRGAFRRRRPMDDREVRDQLLTLLLAGHETTATALAWTLDLLTRHPAALARLRAEVARAVTPTCARSIAESLRLRPVVPLAGRRLTSELSADGMVLPAGTDVTPAIWLAHTRAATATPIPTRSVLSASWTARRQPTRGSRSAAACAAAWAPPSPRWRCASCSRRCCARARAACGQPARRARREAQRDVLATARHAHRGGPGSGMTSRAMAASTG